MNVSGRRVMPTIDVQVHCYERNHPGRPWHAVPRRPPEVTGHEMIKAMDEVGVDGALLISVFYDVQVGRKLRGLGAQAVPRQFALIKPVDSNDPKVGETIEEWAGMDGTVAMRIMSSAPRSRPTRPIPASTRCWPRRAKCDLPVNLMARGRLDQVAELAKRNPDTTLVIDHLGHRAAHEAAGAAGAMGRAAQAAGARARQEHRGQDQRRLHAQPRAVPLQGHPRAGRSASSTRSASIAACGAPTGRAR